MRAALDAGLAPAFEQPAARGWARWRPFMLYVLPLRARSSVVVVGAMAAGWATPTESAAVGALATVRVRGALPRAHAGRACSQALRGTAAISAMILFIIVGATTFAQILSFSGATNGLVQAITRRGAVALRRWSRR